MAVNDLAMSVLVGRSDLGLEPLEINDYESYYVGPQFLGANVSWQRNQVTSPWMDGAVTTNRQRGMVTEPVLVEVLGDGQIDLKTNSEALITAFIQDQFEITVTYGDGAVREYQCEAADYQELWVGSRFIAQQVQVQFQVPRQPVPLVGAF